MYAPGTSITTTIKVSVRATPGGTKLGQQELGASGTIKGALPVYKVFGAASWWWEIDYTTGPDGWSAANYIR